MTAGTSANAVVARVKAFGAFWYDFVVGDDWRVAVGVALALAATFVVSESTTATWWIVPAAVVVLLPYSLWRATRPTPPDR
jgi:tryptophan-rich sensory protein